MDIRLTVNKDEDGLKLLRNKMIVGRVGDDKNRSFMVYVVDENGKPLNLQGKDIQFEAINGQNKRVITKLGISSPTTTGTFRFIPTSPFYSNSGYFKLAYFRISDKDGSLSTNDFEVRILSNAMYSEENAHDYVDGMQAMIQGIVNATNKELTLQMEAIKKDMAATNANINKANQDIVRVNAQIISIQGDIDDLDSDLRKLDMKIAQTSREFDLMVTQKTGVLDAKIVELNAKLDRIEAEIGNVNYISENKLYELIDPLDKGYRVFAKGSGFTRTKSPVDLLTVESMHMTLVQAAINHPPETVPTGHVMKVFGSAGFGQVFWFPSGATGEFWINTRSNQVWNGWNRLVGFKEMDGLLFGNWRLGQNESITLYGKKTGSNVVNPHRVENTGRNVIVPPTSVNAEFVQDSYDKVALDDNLFYTNSTATVNDFINIPIDFNLQEQINRDYPQTKMMTFEQITNYLTAVTVEVKASNLGNTGGKVTLYRLSDGFINPTYVEATSSTSNDITPLTFGTNSASGFRSVCTSDGHAKFLLLSPKMTVASKPEGVRIGYIKLTYKINLTNLNDALFMKLDNLANGYRIFQVDGNIPQNPSWVDKNAMALTQPSHPWVYINGVSNIPYGVGNSGMLMRSRVGANIVTVRYKAFGDETIYKMSKLNTDAWTNWEADDGNGWRPNEAGVTLTTLPLKPMSKRYISLDTSISPIGQVAVGLLDVSGVPTRLIATFELMSGQVFRNVYVGSWSGWRLVGSATSRDIPSGYNLNLLRNYPQLNDVWSTQTTAIASSVTNKPATLDPNANFAVELIALRTFSPSDYSTLQRLTAHTNTTVPVREFIRSVGMLNNAFFATPWVETGAGGGGVPEFPQSLVIPARTASTADVTRGKMDITSPHYATVSILAKMKERTKGVHTISYIETSQMAGYKSDPAYSGTAFQLVYDNVNFGKSVAYGTVSSTGSNIDFKFNITDEVLKDIKTSGDCNVSFTATVPIVKN